MSHEIARVETLHGVRPAAKRFNLALRPAPGRTTIGSSPFSALSVWLAARGAAASERERGNRQPSIQTNKGLTGSRRLGRLKWVWCENRGSSSTLTARSFTAGDLLSGSAEERAQAAGTYVSYVIIWLLLRAKRIWGQA